jgi:regulator of nucleoside diphosphate kinase
MEKRITLTINDYNRLVGLLEFSSARSAPSELVSKLHTHLANANTVYPDQIDSSIVTMNSRVYLMDLVTKRQSEVTLSYPWEAEPRERKISVLSEPGVALLGKKERDIVSWKTPGHVGQFEIVKVNYQPEAANDYYL